MVELMLMLEKAEQDPDNSPIHLLSLDAVKCFDRIDVVHAGWGCPGHDDC